MQPSRKNTFIILAKMLLLPHSEGRVQKIQTTIVRPIGTPYRYTQAAFVKIQITVVRPIGKFTPLHDAMVAILYLIAQSAFAKMQTVTVDVLLGLCKSDGNARYNERWETSGRYNGNALVAAFGRKKPSSELW